MLKDPTLSMGLVLSAALILVMVSFIVATKPETCPGASEAQWTNRGWLCVLEVD